MCHYGQPVVTEYVRDVHRGRHSDFGRRFVRLKEYAHARWIKSRNPKHYDQWRKIMEAVERRR